MTASSSGVPANVQMIHCFNDAALGYATAAAEATKAMSTVMVAFWDQSLKAVGPAPPEPRSWYRHPDARVPTLPDWLELWQSALRPAAAPGASPLQALNPWLAAFARGETWSPPLSPIAPMPLPIAAWQAQFPTARPMTAWPMAFALIAIGCPGAVARPAAEANAAMLDAARLANESVDQVMSSYRSDGGHASVHLLRTPMTERRPPAVIQAAPQVEAVDPTQALVGFMMWPWLMLREAQTAWARIEPDRR
jgi:hypothetical protein